MSMQGELRAGTPLWRDYLELCKPNVVLVMIVTSVIGMFMAVPGMVPPDVLVLGNLGIALCAAAAAAINHLVDRHIDRKMARTLNRPVAQGRLAPVQVIGFAVLLGGLGMAILVVWINALTAWLTLASLLGYAVVYTLYLKRATPQNIVIGGAAGAAPPVLGWAAVTGEVSADALLLFLIIFVWTPPHFWALALYREQEYAKVGIPMLPVTHGSQFTRLHILLYTLLLAAVTVLPFTTRMSGVFYLVGASLLNIGFIYYAWRLYRHYSDALARKTFGYSIQYLTALFAVLLIDHYRAYFAEALQSALY